MTPAANTPSDEIDALRTALAAEQLARREAEARATGAEAMVAHLKLLIAKLKHDRFGASSERGRKLLDQMELELEELEAAATEAATVAAQDGTSVETFTRRKPVRAPLPDHLPRERVVVESPSACPCCGGKLAKLGETITETLEVIPRRLVEAGCWAHGRRNFFKLAEVARAPLAVEAVRRIDAIFDAERPINGLPAGQRLAVRRDCIAPLVAELETWMRAARGKLSRHADVAKAMDYMLKRWEAFTRFLSDGRICLTNNAAERALRGIALGRKSWLFAGSDKGGERAAAMYSLIVTAKLNDIDPRAWLADVLARIGDHPASQLDQLLPWNWARPNLVERAA